MMIRPRYVVLIAVATFVVGGAAACTVSQLVFQTDLSSLATERTALVDKAGRLKTSVREATGQNGQLEGQLNQLSAQTQLNDDQLRATVAGLRVTVAQYQQQLAAAQKALADSQTAAQQYIDALSAANDRVSELSNALMANGQGGLLLNSQSALVPYVVVPPPEIMRVEPRNYYRRR